VLGTFSRLAVRLQAIAHVAQKLADDRRGDLVALGGQRVYQITQTARCPQQRLHRIAPRRGFDQPLEIGHEGRILR
jgi:hypothetical protein